MSFVEIKGVHLKDSKALGFSWVKIQRKPKKKKPQTITQRVKAFFRRHKRLKNHGRIARFKRFHFVNTRANRKLIENKYVLGGMPRALAKAKVKSRIVVKNGKSFIRQLRRFTTGGYRAEFHNTHPVLEKAVTNKRHYLSHFTKPSKEGGYSLDNVLRSDVDSYIFKNPFAERRSLDWDEKELDNVNIIAGSWSDAVQEQYLRTYLLAHKLTMGNEAKHDFEIVASISEKLISQGFRQSVLDKVTDFDWGGLREALVEIDFSTTIVTTADCSPPVKKEQDET